MWITPAKTVRTRALWRRDLNFGGGVLPVRKLVHFEFGLERLGQVFRTVRRQAGHLETDDQSNPLPIWMCWPRASRWL